MKIEPNIVYTLKDSDSVWAFLLDCEEQGISWMGDKSAARVEYARHILSDYAGVYVTCSDSALSALPVGFNPLDNEKYLYYHRTRCTDSIKVGHSYWCGSSKSAKTFLEKCVELGYLAGSSSDAEDEIYTINPDDPSDYNTGWDGYSEGIFYEVSKVRDKIVVAARWYEHSKDSNEISVIEGWMAPPERPLPGFEKLMEEMFLCRT